MHNNETIFKRNGKWHISAGYPKAGKQRIVISEVLEYEEDKFSFCRPVVVKTVEVIMFVRATGKMIGIRKFGNQRPMAYAG